MAKSKQTTPVVGGVDAHKGLHVAAVVDDNDKVLATQSFATTRQGYKLTLTWMRPFGGLQRIWALCGVSPVPASSGKTTRHRLNRGAANSALHMMVEAGPEGKGIRCADCLPERAS